MDDEVVEDGAVVTAEVARTVVGDLDAAAQPAVGGVQLDEPRDLPAGADALAGGVDPQAEEDRGIDRRRAGGLAAGTDVGVETAQIELVDDGGDRADRVICRHLVLRLRARVARAPLRMHGLEVDQAPDELAALRALDPHIALGLDRTTRPGAALGIVGAGPQRRLRRRPQVTGSGSPAHGPARFQPSRRSQVWAGGSSRSSGPADEYGST